MLFLVIVARVVDVQAYGSLAYALALLALLSVFSDLGLRDYFLSKEGMVKNYANVNSLFAFSCTLFLIIAIFQYFLWVSNEGKLLANIFFVLLLEGCAFGILHKIIYYKYQSLNELPYFSKCDAVLKVIPVSLKIVVFLLFEDLVLALLLGATLSFLIYLIWLFKVGFFVEARALKSAFKQFKSLLNDWRSWGGFSVSLLSFFLVFGADKLVVQSVLGMEQLAVYSAAMAFMAIGQVAVGVLWSLYMPRLSRGEVIWGYKKFIVILGSLGFLAAGLYQVIAYWLYGYVYPEAYSYGAYILSLASFYFIFRFPNVGMEIIYIVEERYSAFVKMRIIFGVAALVGYLVLLPIIGVIGAALALVAAEMLLMIGSVLGRRRLSC